LAEPTLNVKLADLEAAVGDFLGYGRGAAFSEPAWSARQQARITVCVQNGLRAFYYPTPQPPGGAAHEWTFLRPVASLTLAAAAQTVVLPDDFGWLDGDLTVSATGQSMFDPVKVTGEGVVRERYAQLPDMTGRPQIAAVVPNKGTTLTASQRFTLDVWPAADIQYTLQLAYYVHPDFLTGSLPYAYGGQAHAETIRAAVIAAAEVELDDERGDRWQYFQERLAASMANDRRGKPELVGYNGDRSDGYEFNRRWIYNGDRITFNGVQY
jgi:hypothetical protein